MKSSYWRSTLKSLAQFIYLQFFITCVSLPVLIAWGLPFSVATFVGNFIFTPFLAVILLLSSLIFFGNLLGFSMQAFIWLVDGVIGCWLYLLSWGAQSWLIAFKKPPNVVLVVIMIISFLIIHFKILKTLGQSIAAFVIFFLFIVVYLKYVQMPDFEYSYLDKRPMRVHCIYHQGLTVVIPCVSGCSPEALAKWVDYTFMPFIIKQTGLLCIDNLILLETDLVKITTFFEALSKTIAIKKWYIFNAAVKAYLPELHVLSGDYTFMLGSKNRLQIKLKKNKKRINCSEICLTIDNTTTTLYSPNLRSPHHTMQKRSSKYESQKSFAYRCA